jgi:hypothetical protein
MLALVASLLRLHSHPPNQASKLARDVFLFILQAFIFGAFVA